MECGTAVQMIILWSLGSKSAFEAVRFQHGHGQICLWESAFESDLDRPKLGFPRLQLLMSVARPTLDVTVPDTLVRMWLQRVSLTPSHKYDVACKLLKTLHREGFRCRGKDLIARELLRSFSCEAVGDQPGFLRLVEVLLELYPSDDEGWILDEVYGLPGDVEETTRSLLLPHISSVLFNQPKTPWNHFRAMRRKARHEIASRGEDLRRRVSHAIFGVPC
jgi:hypothetical protein